MTELHGKGVYRIGQLAGMAGVPAKTIRYYESIRLIPPAQRTAVGYRLYGRQDLERLRFIKRAKGLGLSLAAIREVIATRDGGQAPCRHVIRLLDDKLAAVRERLTVLVQLEHDLTHLREVALLVEPRVTEGGYCCILETEELPAVLAPPGSRETAETRAD